MYYKCFNSVNSFLLKLCASSYLCKNDILETNKAVSPVKDECPGKGSPGKNRDIFMVLVSAVRNYERVL